MNTKRNLLFAICLGVITGFSFYFFFDSLLLYLNDVLSPFMSVEVAGMLLFILHWVIVILLGGAMAVFTYYFVLMRLPMAFKKLSKKKKVVSLIFSFLFSLYITASIIFSSGDLLTKPIMTWYHIISFLLFLLLFTTIFIVFVAQDGYECYYKKTEVSVRRLFLYSLPLIIIWVLYLLGSLPANATSDTFYQWSLIHSDPMILDNWHPMIHSLFYKLITLVWNSMTAVALVQIIILGLIYGYGMYSLEKTGFSRKWLWLITFGVAISPLNGFFVNTLWKDILYSGFALLLMIYIFNIIISKGLWLKSKWNMLLFALLLFLTSTFRSNGIVPAILVGLFLLIFIWINHRKYVGRVIVIGVVFIVAFFSYSVGVMKAFNVGQPPYANGVGLPLQVAAAVLNQGEVKAEDRAFFNEIKTAEDWKSYYPYLADPIKNVTPVDNEFLEANAGSFLKKTVGLALENPRIAIVAYLNQTDLLWSYVDKGRFFTFMYDKESGESILNAFKAGNPNYIAQHPHGFDAIDINAIEEHETFLTPVVNGLFVFAQTLLRGTFIYNPAFYLGLLTFLSFAFMVKRGKGSVLPILFLMMTLLGNVASLYMSIVAHDLRYAYPILFAAPFLVAALFVRPKVDKPVSEKEGCV